MCSCLVVSFLRCVRQESPHTGASCVPRLPLDLHDTKHAVWVQMFMLRKEIEHRVSNELGLTDDDVFFASLSSRTLVYKGQLTPDQVRFPQLRLTSPFCWPP